MTKQTALRQDRKQRGMCFSCGARPPTPGQTRCEKCRGALLQRQRRYVANHKEQIYKKQRERYAKRKVEGKCPRCGAPRNEEPGILCVNCSYETGHPGCKNGAYRHESKQLVFQMAGKIPRVKLKCGRGRIIDYALNYQASSNEL